MMNLIEVEHLTKDYGSGRGVFDVSFSVKEGEVFGFLGPNGAGKSTTIRHLMGFSKPDNGSTKLFGKETFTHYSEVLNHVGYIPGEIALPAGLTGWDFIRMMQDMYHIHDQKMLDQMLDRFEMSDAVLAGDTKYMSLGVKRKLAVVTAFMSDPQVLILDEPTSGLDPIMQQQFVNFIIEEKQRGKTILLSSHIFSEVDATCERIAIIKDGKIVSEFLADDLKHASRKQYLIRFADSEAYGRFLSSCNCNVISLVRCEEDERTIRLFCEDRDINELVRMLSVLPVEDFHHIKETLEDYFMSYYKEDRNFGGAI